MVQINPAQLALVLLTMILLSTMLAMFVGWGWMFSRLAKGQSLLPSEPLVSLSPPRWRGGTVFLAFSIYVVMNVLVAGLYARALGRPPGDEDGPFSLTEQMFLVSVINCLLLVVLPFLIRATSGARLGDLGLSLTGWERQAAVGAVATLIAAPAVYSIQFAALRIWKSNAHPLERMLRKEFNSVGVADLAVLSAVILAPIVEELMFRGLLQRWCIDFWTRRARIPVRMPQPAGVLDPVAADGAIATEQECWPELTAAAESASKGERAPSRAGVIMGITMTSLCFAAVHAAQWPAPIPLFVLALIIGSVYYRTGSLIAAILMHATFNGFSTLAMFVAILGGQLKEGGNAVEGAWMSRTAVSVERGICEATDLEAVWQNRNSKEFLLDELVSD